MSINPNCMDCSKPITNRSYHSCRRCPDCYEKFMVSECIRKGHYVQNNTMDFDTKEYHGCYNCNTGFVWSKN
jgi:hypothetical protein